MTGLPNADGPYDSHLLQLVPSDPIVSDASRVVPAQRSSLAVIGDSRWDLTPLVHKKTVAHDLSINFDTFPPAYRSTAKRLVWACINLPTPVEELERSASTRGRLSASTVATFAWTLRMWMKWLASQHIYEFYSVTDEHFEQYSVELGRKNVDRADVANKLFAVTRAWLYAPYLPEADRLTRPTWEQGVGGRSEVLGPANWSSENKTAPIHPQTLSALLVWAMRFVNDFSADILTAKAMKSVPCEPDPRLSALGPYDRFRAYAQERRLGSGTIAGWVAPSRPRKRCFAKGFIGWQLGIPAAETQAVNPDCLFRGLEPGDEADLPLEVTGTIDGERWTTAINYYEVGELCRHLATAAFIVIAYLTGMRGEECRALEHGCCRARTNQSTGQVHYAIHGRTFKGALDESGNTIPAGAEREHPWLAIAPVAKAVAVMESLFPDSELLFPIDAFTQAPSRTVSERPVHSSMVRDRIDDLIAWSNRASLSLGRHDETIPADPDGMVTVGRFRRSLAWFIYRKPGGRVALGVQYGHLRGHTTDGYGSRVASGLRDVFPMEEALARVDYLEEAYDRLQDGERVTGPASRRYTEALHVFDRQFRGRYLSNKQAAALRVNPQLRIYDNAQQFVTCCYDQAKALCHPDRQTAASSHESPDITRCQPTCGNIARTDRNIDQIAAAVAKHELEIDSPTTPQPLRARLQDRVANLRRIVDEHQGEEREP